MAIQQIALLMTAYECLKEVCVCERVKKLKTLVGAASTSKLGFVCFPGFKVRMF